MNLRNIAVAAVLGAALTACGDKQDQQPAEGDASGEVLAGTISDDMLPLESLQSRAPLAEPSSAPSGSGASSDVAAPADEPTAATSPNTVAEAPE